MGSGKGQTKRVASSSANQVLNNPFHDALGSLHDYSLSVQPFIDSKINENVGDITYMKYYLPEVKVKDFEKNVSANMSFILTEVLHDILANKLAILNHMDYPEPSYDKKLKDLLNNINYKDYEVKYELERDWMNDPEFPGDTNHIALFNKKTNKQIVGYATTRYTLSANQKIIDRLNDHWNPAEALSELLEVAMDRKE